MVWDMYAVVHTKIQSDGSGLRAASLITSYSITNFKTSSMGRSHSAASVALLSIQHHAQPATDVDPIQQHATTDLAGPRDCQPQAN